MHLPDAADVTTPFATVFTTDPAFRVDLLRYDGCQ
jgi:hypothetical protein